MTVTAFDFANLPLLAISRIGDYLKDETAFRDKVDIAIDVAALKVAGKCFNGLTCELISYIDPLSSNGEYSPKLMKNIKDNKKRWIVQDIAQRSWGLSSVDLINVQKKKNANGIHYRLLQVKRASERKFDGSYERLKAYTSSRHLERYHKLKDALNKYKACLRTDSKSCDKYVQSGKGDPNTIAKVIKEWEFFHLYTDYRRYYTQEAVGYYLEYGFYDWNQIIQDAKKKALKDFVCTQPKKASLIPMSLSDFLEK